MPSISIAGSYGSFNPSFKGFYLVFSILAISISIPTVSLNYPQHLMLIQILMMTILTCIRRHLIVIFFLFFFLIVILMCISFMMSDVAPLFMCYVFADPLYFFFKRTDLGLEKIQQIVWTGSIQPLSSSAWYLLLLSSCIGSTDTGSFFTVDQLMSICYY